MSVAFSVPRGLPGPYIIGATGGSGTRVVARIVRAGGLYIGTTLNPSEDALLFGHYSNRWINAFTADGRSLDLQAKMTEDLERVLREHLAGLDDTARAWGWKEPRSSYLLPFFHEQFPGLKFLHVVRDGRDMAYSANQNQLTKHRDALLDSSELTWPEPLQSIALWARLNTRVADYGEQRLRGQYARIRFEDLCREPVKTIGRVLEFFGLEGDVESMARTEVASPASLARWRSQPPETIEALNRQAGSALRRFGYET